MNCMKHQKIRIRRTPSPPELLKSHIFKSIQRLRKYGFLLIYHIELPHARFALDSSCATIKFLGVAMTELTHQRFSQIYLERGVPTQDSKRFRNRLAAYFEQHLSEHHGFYVIRNYEAETGAHVPGTRGYQCFEAVFETGELRDVLDAITIVFRTLMARGVTRYGQLWLSFVARALHEENVGYSVDESGVVHYHVDQEFERNRVSTLAVLQGAFFGAVRACFEDAYRHLDSDPTDTKAAVRSMFEALETLARLCLPGQRNLNRWLAKNALKEKCLAVAGGDQTEQAAVAGFFDAFGEWVEAIHLYRHGQPSIDPVAPSEEAAVFVLSTGSAYLRQIALYASRLDTEGREGGA